MSGDDEPATYQTVQTDSAPWEKQQPYLESGFELAKTNVLEKPTEPYPNSAVVPFAPQSETGLQMQEQRALAGSPVTQAGQAMVQDTLEGDYLSAGNPYFQQAVTAATRPMVETFNEDVLPGIQSGFSGAGRYGSGLQQRGQQRAGEALLRQVGDVAGTMSASMYGDERDRQMQAGLLAPDMAAQDYTDIAQLKQAGAEREGMAGAELQDEINRFYAEQNAPKDALSNYMALIKGGYGSQGSETTPIYRNKPAEYLGAASTAAGIGSALFGKGSGIFRT